MNAFGLGHEHRNLVIDYSPCVIDIEPCVTWSRIDIDTFEKIKIPNDYSTFRGGAMIGTITLPLGWSPYQDEDGEPY